MREIFVSVRLHEPFVPVRQFEFESTDSWIHLFKIKPRGNIDRLAAGPTECKQVGDSIPKYVRLEGTLVRK